MKKQPKLVWTDQKKDEKLAWNKGIDVHFQQNAWADTNFSIEWVEKTLVPIVKDSERYFLLCINVISHIERTSLRKPKN